MSRKFYTENAIRALESAERYAGELAAQAATALDRAVNHPNPPRSGDAWEAYRVAAGHAVEARREAEAQRERIAGACQSCGERLIPGTLGNVAYCDYHDQTCDNCDGDLMHPHGRTI